MTCQEGERTLCGCCREFVDEPAVLERELPALLILSSAYGDTRGNQGICAVHECWVTPTLSCSGFRARVPRE